MDKPHRRRWATVAASLVGHAGVIFVLLSAHGDPPRVADEEPAPIPVELVAPQPAVDVTKPPTPEPPAAPEPPPPRAVLRPTPLRAKVDPLPASKGPSADGKSEVSDAELASASTAGAPSGGACNMTRWLQTALRKDGRVQAAVAEASAGRAIRVWNGDWVRHGEQEGNGLAAVREAIMWEVAFAPAACRAEPVHGLIALSLNDGPGASRVVMGSGDWRWSDLLHPPGRPLPGG
jgi:hypothetical protein